MREEDLIIMHANAQHILDRAKQIQTLISVQEGQKDDALAINEKLWEHDLKKAILDIHVNIDSLEVLTTYYYKIHRSEAK